MRKCIETRAIEDVCGILGALRRFFKALYRSSNRREISAMIYFILFTCSFAFLMSVFSLITA